MMRMRLSGIRAALAAGVLAFAAACTQQNSGTQDPEQPKPQVLGPEISVREKVTERNARVIPDVFEYERYDVRTDGDSPVACLAFNSALSTRVDYSPYIDISPQTQIALTVSGDELCIGGLSFGEAANLTLKAGLPGAGRDLALAEDALVTLDFGDRPTYVGFKGDGVILPRVNADGVGIETVNVDKLAVSVSRVTDRALVFKRITAGFSHGRGDYYWTSNDEEPWNLSEELWTGELDVENKMNTPVTTVFSMASAVERLQPGAYYIRVEEKSDAAVDTSRPAAAERWLIVTDLSLVAFEGADQTLVRVRSIDTAEVAREVRLDLVARNNEILASRRTDSNGQVSFDAALLKGEGPKAPRMIMAYDANNDFAVLDLDRPNIDLSQQPIGGREAPDVVDGWLYTDRGVYRPGETLFVNALLRDPSAAAVTDRAGDLRIYGPNGLEAHRWRFERAREAGGLSHAYEFSKNAARGMWRVDAHVDGIGVVASTRVSVEDFVPQRIELVLDADTETPVLAGERRSITADVRFLYGAPGAGLDVETRARVEVAPNPFPDFEGYSFGRNDEDFREREIDMNDAVADGAGRARLVVDPSREGVESSKPLRLRTVITAIEPGGRPVSDDLRIPFRPRADYLGLQPDFDRRAQEGEQAAFKLVSLNAADGTLRGGDIEWRLVRFDWDYDWYRNDSGRWTWRRTRNVVEVDAGELELSTDAPIDLVTRQLDWGDYQLVVEDVETGAEASYQFWAGWGGGPQSGSEAPDQVRISKPDEAVRPKSRITLDILPPFDGEAEIVVANEKILETRTLSVRAKGEQIEFNVDEDWGAGAYIMVSVYTPRHETRQPLPRRAVGVVHIPVDVSERTFEVNLSAPEVVEPRQTISFEIEAADGPRTEGVYATLAAVDEGILLLTKFDSPDPTDWFFAKRRLGVGMKDDYGRMLDPNQGAATKPRSGGDQIGGAGLTVVPTKTVALFQGPVALGRDGKAEIELELPDYNGELRLMAVVWSDSGLGAVSRPITVRDDVPAELILPRFMAPGDEAVATLTVDNVAGDSGDYTARLGVGAGLDIEEASQTINLARGERKDAPIALSANAEEILRFNLAVTGPGGFSVARDYDFEIRSPYLPASEVERVEIQPGESWTVSADAFAGYTPGSAETFFSFSPLPLDAGALYESLDRYPYGCTEQTVSRAIPLLYADNLASIAGIKTDTEIRARVQDAVSTILNRQGLDGAIGLWRMGDGHATPWLGAYATDFLARAKEAGFEVPDAALDKAYQALGYVAEQKQLWNVAYDYDVYRAPWNDDTRDKLKGRSAAYAAYVLARAGKIDASRLRFLHDQGLKEIESPLARAQVGAALAMIGDRSRAVSAFDKAIETKGYQNGGDYYQTTRRDIAGMLALAGEAGLESVTSELTEDIVSGMPEPDSLTTQEKAFLLLAANALSGGAREARVEAEGAVEKISSNQSYRMTDDMVMEGEPQTFTNAGRGVLYLTATTRGAPSTAPRAVSEGLRLSKTIARPNGAAADLSRVRQGDRFVVTITVEATDRRLHPVIIADLLPAGFEIESVLTPSSGGAYPTAQDLDRARVAEARDDRFVAAVDVVNRQEKTVGYIVRAVTPGDFAIPGAVAEDMYRMDVFARTGAGRVSITAAE